MVDLSGVELLDATGLGVLAGAHRRARLQDRELVLRDARPRVARLLSLTRLDRVITVERRPVRRRPDGRAARPRPRDRSHDAGG